MEDPIMTLWIRALVLYRHRVPGHLHKPIHTPMAFATKLAESYTEVSRDVVHLGTHIVKPRHLQPSSRFPLSNIDLAFTKPEYNILVFLFRNYTTESTYQNLLERLRASLSETLVHYPVLAGRLAKDDHTGRVEVEMNSKGIHFVEATIDASLHDWEDIRLCPVDVNLSLDAELSDPFEDPIMKIQVIKFRCGGIAISVHFMHRILDGYSLVNFLNSWSQVHRGVPIEMYPSFIRDNVLVARDPPRLDAPVPLMIEGLDENPVVSFTDMEEVNQPSNLITLRMERAAVQACVWEAENGAFSYGKVTSFEAVSSLLWSSIVRARGLPHHLDTTFLFPVNIRGSKFGLNVPESYFGNAVGLSQVHARRVGDLLDSDKSYAASLIHKAKLGCERRSVQSLIDWLEMNPLGSIARLAHWRRGITSTALGNLAVYDLDFGKGGLSQLCFLPSAVAPHMSFAAMLPPPPEKKNTVDIVIGLKEEHRDALLNDERFTKYLSGEEIKMWTSSHIRRSLRRVIK